MVVALFQPGTLSDLFGLLFWFVVLFCLLVRSTWWLMGILFSGSSSRVTFFRGAKPRSARLFFQRPLLGRWSSLAVKTLRILSLRGQLAALSRTSDFDSSPPPAGCTRDLESRGRPPFPLPDPRPYLEWRRSAFLIFPIAAIDPAPDLSSFGAGVELMVFTALFTIGALLVLNWIVKTMRGSG